MMAASVESLNKAWDVIENVLTPWKPSVSKENLFEIRSRTSCFI